MNFFLTIFVLFLNFNVFANQNCTNILQNNITAIAYYQKFDASLNTMNHLQSVELKCNEGYFLNNDTNKTKIQLSCNNGKLFVDGVAGDIPICKTILCSIPSMSTAVSNVKNTPEKELKLGEKFVFECRSSHAIFANGEFYTSVEATCGKGGNITPTTKRNEELVFTKFQNCEKFCDISSVINYNNIDLAKSTIKKSGESKGQPINQTFVPLNSILNLKCKEGYEIRTRKDGEDITITEYNYNCQDSKKTSYECKPNKAKPLNGILPTSNIAPDTTLNISCFPSSIITINSKILGAVISSLRSTGAVVKETFGNDARIKMQCQENYAFTDNGILKTDFEITCNGKTGYWDGTKACNKVCNLEELKTKTQNVASIETINLTNNIDVANNKYINKGERVRVNCKQGATEKDSYEIRSTGLPYYETSCLDGTNFSVGSKVPICEKRIPRCKNSDIIVTGDIKNYSILGNQETNAGGVLPFICEGDSVQKGLYFENGKNQNNGSDGVPICQYTDKNGSQWSHQTFKCYTGCIAEEGSNITLVQNGFMKIMKQSNKIEDIYAYYPQNGINIRIENDHVVLPSFLYNMPTYGMSIKNFMTGKIDPEKGISTMDEISNTGVIHFHGELKRRLGYLVKIDRDIYYCKSSRNLEKFQFQYKLLKLAVLFFYKACKPDIHHSRDKIALSIVDYNNPNATKGDCSESTGVSKNKSPQMLCTGHLLNTYSNLKISDLVKISPKSSSNFTISDITAIMAIPDDSNKWGTCDGHLYTVSSTNLACSSQRSVPINIEYKKLIKFSGSKETVIDKTFRNQNSSNKAADWPINSELQPCENF